MFADTDYKITGKMELYFQNAMYLVFKMLGFYTDVKRTTSNGRIDIVLKTKDYIYVMELKLSTYPLLHISMTNYTFHNALCISIRDYFPLLNATCLGREVNTYLI